MYLKKKTMNDVLTQQQVKTENPRPLLSLEEDYYDDDDWDDDDDDDDD